MSINIQGVVINGVVVPASPLPDGACVEIVLQTDRPRLPPALATHVTPGELRQMPRRERQVILATAAAIAEEDYRDDKELTGFTAFSEESDDDSH